MDSLRQSFDSLRSCPKDIYVSFFLHFTETYSYFCLSQILVIYLHQEFNASDREAGSVYGFWGCSITAWGLATGWVNDRLGVRRSLLFGFLVSFLGSFIIATTVSKTVLYFTLFGILPLGNSIGIPMLTVSIKRYTNVKNRGFAFSIFYSVMNIAAFISGPVIDIFNYNRNPNPIQNNSMFATTISGNRYVILSTTLSYAISFIVAFKYTREIKMNDDDSLSDYITNTSISPNKDIEMTVSPMVGNNSSNNIKDNDEHNTSINSNNNNNHNNEEFNLYQIIKDLCTSKTLARYAVFTLLLVNLKAVFRHLDATFPTYLLRTYGSNFPKGLMYSINPAIIVFLTPLVGALLQKYKHFDMIKYGGFVTASAPFFLAYSNSIWACIMFAVVLSLGEAIWSPRTYDYMISVAPEGKEATFAALATMPLFLAKFPVGFLSGFLLNKYMPEGGTTNGKMLWLIIGIVTLSSPVSVCLLEKWIREPESNTSNNSNSVSNNEIGPKFTILNSDDNDEIDNDNDHMCKVTDCDN